MKPKDIFSIALRLLGLVFLYFGLMTVPPMASLFFRAIREPGDFMSSLFTVVWLLLVARWLLRGAPLLVHLAYPEPSGQADGKPGELSPAQKAGA